MKVLIAEDDDKIRQGLVDILQDEEKLCSMGRQSRRLCETKYSWDEVARKTIDLYGLGS